MVENEDGFASYSVSGQASGGMLRARFGDLGRVAVRFEPSGKVSRREPPRWCQGEPEVTRRGVFVGAIRFRGEGGYTEVTANRGRGSITTSPRWRCKGKDGAAGDGAGILVEEALSATVLGAFAAGGEVVFATVRNDSSGEFAPVFFLAGTRQWLGPVKVERFGFGIADQKAGTFEFDPGLTTATVSPPRPFSGSAGFQRGPDGTVAWSGSLAVSLPGAPNLALTGPAFTTDLARPKTAGELFALLGQPGMTGP